MQRKLSSRYSDIFNNRLTKPIAFLRDIYRQGKLSELLSFIIWEVLHTLRLIPKRRYLQFDERTPLILTNGSSCERDLGEDLQRFFAERGLNIVATQDDWVVLAIGSDGARYGSLRADDRVLYKSNEIGKPASFLARFPSEIKAIFITSRNSVFVCCRGAVHSSEDDGLTFRETLEFDTPVSFFRHNNGMTEMPDGTLIIGEYGNVWEGKAFRKIAYLYFSTDNGGSWARSDFLIRSGANKHVHIVAYSHLFSRLFVTDGDNTKKLWASNSLMSPSLQTIGSWKPVNRFHIQTGGYTSVAETTQKVLFGTDYLGGSNFLVESTDGRRFSKRMVPDPFRRSPILNMVKRRSEKGVEIWANLPHSTPRSLLMYSADDGANWSKVIEYSNPDQKVSLLSSASNSVDDLYLSIEDVKRARRGVYRIADQP